MRMISLALLFVMLCLGRADAQGERRVALVIGNSAYVHMGRLANPRNDAVAISRQLAEMGFEIVGNGPQLDLDKAGMEQAIRDFGRVLRGGAVGLFYYAGHGVQVRNRNFLVPVNAQVQTEAEIALVAIDANLALEQLEASGARLSIVILDACRNNPFPGGQFRSVGAGLAQMQAAAGTVISFAAQPGALALDGNADGNSPYTTALLEAMRRPGLNVLDVFNEVGVSVARATGRSQQPWVSSSPIEGRFYFTPSIETAREGAPAGGGDAASIEVSFWNAVQNSRSLASLREYARQYPEGRFIGLARLQITELERTAQVNVPAARPVQVSPAGAPPPPAQPQAAAPRPPAAPQVAQAPAAAPRMVGTQTYVGTSSGGGGENCGVFTAVSITVTDGRVVGTATSQPPRRAGRSISWGVSGTMTAAGQVSLRMSTEDSGVQQQRRGLSFTGALRGDAIELSQPSSVSGCDRALRLTRR